MKTLFEEAEFAVSADTSVTLYKVNGTRYAKVYDRSLFLGLDLDSLHLMPRIHALDPEQIVLPNEPLVVDLTLYSANLNFSNARDMRAGDIGRSALGVIVFCVKDATFDISLVVVGLNSNYELACWDLPGPTFGVQPVPMLKLRLSQFGQHPF